MDRLWIYDIVNGNRIVLKMVEDVVNCFVDIDSFKWRARMHGL
jgi:hypothetical protein